MISVPLFDNCITYYNPDQRDDDYDGIGNTCELLFAGRDRTGGGDEISCEEDSDCGEDGFIGNEFCIGDNIFRNFESFMCINPKEENSSCESDTTEILIQQCQFACFDGDCIRCNEDLDCNDNNSQTEDFCRLPGTRESFCENISGGEHACSDGIDNDADRFIDYPADAGCDGPLDDSEEPFNPAQCNDGIDNDNDGFIDYSADPQCDDVWDNDESR